MGRIYRLLVVWVDKELLPFAYSMDDKGLLSVSPPPLMPELPKLETPTPAERGDRQ